MTNNYILEAHQMFYNFKLLVTAEDSKVQYFQMKYIEVEI